MEDYEDCLKSDKQRNGSFRTVPVTPKFRLNSGRAQYIRNGGKLGRKVGSIKTTEQKKEEHKDIISYLKRGYSVRNTAKLTSKGISTVQRIKTEFSL